MTKKAQTKFIFLKKKNLPKNNLKKKNKAHQYHLHIILLKIINKNPISQSKSTSPTTFFYLTKCAFVVCSSGLLTPCKSWSFYFIHFFPPRPFFIKRFKKGFITILILDDTNYFNVFFSFLQIRAPPQPKCTALWVGNVDPELVTEKQMSQLFGKCGKVASVRILAQKYCAFVNYVDPSSAVIAMEKLQVKLITFNFKIQIQIMHGLIIKC